MNISESSEEIYIQAVNKMNGTCKMRMEAHEAAGNYEMSTFYYGMLKGIAYATALVKVAEVESEVNEFEQNGGIDRELAVDIHNNSSNSIIGLTHTIEKLEYQIKKLEGKIVDLQKENINLIQRHNQYVKDHPLDSDGNSASGQTEEESELESEVLERDTNFSSGYRVTKTEEKHYMADNTFGCDNFDELFSDRKATDANAIDSQLKRDNFDYSDDFSVDVNELEEYTASREEAENETVDDEQEELVEVDDELEDDNEELIDDNEVDDETDMDDIDEADYIEDNLGIDDSELDIDDETQLDDDEQLIENEVEDEKLALYDIDNDWSEPAPSRWWETNEKDKELEDAEEKSLEEASDDSEDDGDAGDGEDAEIGDFVEDCADEINPEDIFKMTGILDINYIKAFIPDLYDKLRDAAVDYVADNNERVRSEVSPANYRVAADKLGL